jgi:PAS domain S-box-containing protein
MEMEMVQPSPSLQRKIDRKRGFAFGLVMFLIMLIASTISGRLFYSLRNDEENRLVQTIGTILGESVGRISFSGKYHARILLEEMRKQLPELAYISIESPQGRIESHTQDELRGQTVTDQDREVIERSLQQNGPLIREFSANSTAIKEVILPYRSGISTVASGVVRVGINFQEAREKQRRYLLVHLLLIILLTLSAVWIMQILSRHFAARLHASEKALERSHELFSLFLRHSPIYAFIKEVDAKESRVLHVSDNFQDMVGISADKMVGKNMVELFPPDFAAKITADDWAVASGGKVLKIDEDLGGRNFTTVKFPIIQGEKTLLAGYTIDITDRKETLTKLAYANALTNSVLESTAEAILVVTADGRIARWNQRFIDLWQVPQQVVDLRMRDPLLQHLTAHMKNPEEFYDKAMALYANPGRFSEDLLETVDGRFIERYSQPLWLEGQIAGRFWSFRDVTSRKRTEQEKLQLEARLRQAEKMESIGQLAGGVAHDFNNMLSVILGHTELAMARLDPSQEIYEDLVEIHKAATRSADTTRQLLAFARKQTVIPRVIDLNQTIEGMLKMLHRLIGENIQLQWLPGASLWPVRIDPSQVDQILANLCVNARGAIDGSGSIAVSTANHIISTTDELSADELPPGDYVRLKVSDSGCGMDQQTLSHIFEPFFTTKEVGKGTGLGLATVYGVIKQNGGTISADSEVGHGTTFTILLPRHLGQEAEESDSALPDTKTTATTATLLVVEDEPAVLTMTATMLRSLGYSILCASTPEEALRLATSDQTIDLLITDMIMPVMNGRELSEQLHQHLPTLKCLYLSGYSADIIGEPDNIGEDVCFLQKPFTLAELTEKVRQALDGSCNGG